MEASLEVLRTIRLTGGIFLDAEFTAPWCVNAQVTPDDCHPLAPASRSIIAYHYVSAGRLWLQVGEAEPAEVAAGQLVVLPRNDPHILGSGLDYPPIAADALMQATFDHGVTRIVHGGGGEATRVWCGFLLSETTTDPLVGLLPSVMTLDMAQGMAGPWIESSFRFAVGELAAGEVRSPTLLARLAELLFIEAVQHYVAGLPAEQRRWLGGLHNPFVSRALTKLHDEPERHWTTEALAQEVGLSRSAFAERFTELVGVPPMRYLTGLRMQRAAQRLRETPTSIARVAEDAGYESEASFTKAFKRAFGMPPATWRREQQGGVGTTQRYTEQGE
ncbi:MAG: AraC family transcriptional regulator [Halomonas sp.]|jgi:AraC-like DNA-binding protein|uniref:AraC family transcriptional regulator n=1 Tax=Billgrantia tianxiuensis TaxID=2497861 RepID=A0A6I6SHD0_9GAMM|nr:MULTISPECIES: AraC family transcriptional regulator [Halomonas]MCE8033187.1 AraC family transcriptional regulator [Halomonas sp. MCCC 1A11057]MDX5434636.1 AraC family transcriptional regulator [Halomonas sp.]QHC48942.1 AraC family transcriptional regulator [Halomonas tianxiuensis]